MVALWQPVELESDSPPENASAMCEMEAAETIQTSDLNRLRYSFNMRGI
jgi:hypothetical protein